MPNLMIKKNYEDRRKLLQYQTAARVLFVHFASTRNLAAFSVERLIDFLTAFGQDVEIIVRPTRKQHGEVSPVA
jgi:hypothetical protein